MLSINKTILLLALVGCILLINCSSKKETFKLDMAEYLAAASPDDLSPNQAQVDMLRAVLPEDPFRPAPPISDRAYWGAIAQTDDGKR